MQDLLSNLHNTLELYTPHEIDAPNRPLLPICQMSLSPTALRERQLPTGLPMDSERDKRDEVPFGALS